MKRYFSTLGYDSNLVTKYGSLQLNMILPDDKVFTWNGRIDESCHFKYQQLQSVQDQNVRIMNLYNLKLKTSQIETMVTNQHQFMILRNKCVFTENILDIRPETDHLILWNNQKKMFQQDKISDIRDIKTLYRSSIIEPEYMKLGSVYLFNPYEYYFINKLDGHLMLPCKSKQ